MVDEDGEARGKSYFESLALEERVRFEALLRRLADRRSLPTNPDRWRHEEDGIYSIRSTGHCLAAFIDGAEVVVTHGFECGSRVPDAEIDRAKDLREHYYQESEG